MKYVNACLLSRWTDGDWLARAASMKAVKMSASLVDGRQDSLYGFPILFTVTSEHIRLFAF